jgi:hypothetical protein
MAVDLHSLLTIRPTYNVSKTITILSQLRFQLLVPVPLNLDELDKIPTQNKKSVLRKKISILLVLT